MLQQNDITKQKTIHEQKLKSLNKSWQLNLDQQIVQLKTVMHKTIETLSQKHDNKHLQ